MPDELATTTTDDTHGNMPRTRFIEDAGTADTHGHGRRVLPDDTEGHGRRVAPGLPADLSGDTEGHMPRARIVEDAREARDIEDHMPKVRYG